MKPSALWKDFREEELFYPLSVNLPGNAAPLQHGKARVTDSELSNPATFPLRSPESLPRHMMAQLPTRKHRGLLDFCGLDNIRAANLASDMLSGCHWRVVAHQQVRQPPAVGKGPCPPSHDAGDQLCPAVPLEVKKKKPRKVVDDELHKGNCQRRKPNLFQALSGLSLDYITQHQSEVPL